MAEDEADKGGIWGRLQRMRTRGGPERDPLSSFYLPSSEQIERDNRTFDTPAKAYAEAERRIRGAQRSGTTGLRIELRYLKEIPSSIGDHTALQFLSLDGTQVSDLAPLAGLTALQSLYLYGTQVGDLAPLAGLSALRFLRLSGTQVTDLAPLAGLTALQALWLHRTKVRELAPLAGLTALQTLRLDGTQVGDLVPLAGLTALATGAQSDTPPITMGLQFDRTPVAQLAPFDRFLALKQPATTVETINYLRRGWGLPAFFPEGYQRPVGFEPPVPDEPVPPPVPAPPPPGPVAEPEPPKQGFATRYAAPPDGPIDIDRGAGLPDAERARLADLQAELVEASDDLAPLVQRSNAYAFLSPHVEKYRGVLARQDLRDGDIDIIYARGLRFQDAYEQLQADIAKGNLPEADARLTGPMRVLLSLHGPFLQGTERGLQLYEQTERDRRTREEELALKERQRALNGALVAEASETTTAEALDELRASTDMIETGRHPERASVAGRNAIRNYLIALSDLARRYVRKQVATPGRAAATTVKVAGGAVAGAIVTNTALGKAAIVTGAAVVDGAIGTGGALAQVAADFMVRHAGQFRDLARAGGEGFVWLEAFVDWLVAAISKK